MILLPNDIDVLSNHTDLIFTNGCFDLLHIGHTRLIQYCATLGEVVVALNSDESVRWLKGPSRPIHKLEDRLELIHSIKGVQYVTFFREDTPLELIRLIRPKIIVKGGDYKETEVVGYDFVKSYGGEVKIFSYLPGYSTTLSLGRARASQRPIDHPVE